MIWTQVESYFLSFVMGMESVLTSGRGLEPTVPSFCALGPEWIPASPISKSVLVSHPTWTVGLVNNRTKFHLESFVYTGLSNIINLYIESNSSFLEENCSFCP
jgi:hypothetical protein